MPALCLLPPLTVFSSVLFTTSAESAFVPVDCFAADAITLLNSKINAQQQTKYFIFQNLYGVDFTILVVVNIARATPRNNMIYILRLIANAVAITCSSSNVSYFHKFFFLFFNLTLHTHNYIILHLLRISFIRHCCVELYCSRAYE